MENFHTYFDPEAVGSLLGDSPIAFPLLTNAAPVPRTAITITPVVKRKTKRSQSAFISIPLPIHTHGTYVLIFTDN